MKVICRCGVYVCVCVECKHTSNLTLSSVVDHTQGVPASIRPSPVSPFHIPATLPAGSRLLIIAIAADSRSRLITPFTAVPLSPKSLNHSFPSLSLFALVAQGQINADHKVRRKERHCEQHGSLLYSMFTCNIAPHSPPVSTY